LEILNLSQERKDILDSLKDAIVVLDEEKAKEVAENIINEKINPTLAIKYSIANAAIKVGEKFDSGEYYLPHLVMAGDLMEAVSAIFRQNKLSKKRSLLSERFKQICTAWGKTSFPRC